MSVLYLRDQGCYLRKNGGRYIVTQKQEELKSIPKAAIERVVVLGNCQISTQALGDLLGDGVEVVYLSSNGRFRGILEPGYPKNVFVRLAQYERSLEPDYALVVARELATAKLEGSLRSIAAWERRDWITKGGHTDGIKAAKQRLVECQDTAAVRGQEAAAARTHFAVLGDALPPPFEWHGRNRRPPRDPVNALLSLTYMLALSEVISACYAHGLDPYIGFLHELDYSRPSLALDLLEPLRTLHCDHLVLGCLQREELAVADFQYSPEHGCRLTPEGFRTFIDLYQTTVCTSHGRRSSMKAQADALATTIADAVRQRIHPVFTFLH